MTNVQVIKELTNLKTYCSATSLDVVEYAIKVFQKLESCGISEPLETEDRKSTRLKTRHTEKSRMPSSA